MDFANKLFTKRGEYMRFLDLFSGIGGFRLGMETAGHKCIGWVEWDKHARKSYEAIHETEGEWTAHDITTVSDDDLGKLRDLGIDCICGGFPCQAFSVAGKRGGFSDTRGTMFFEIARFAKQIKPRLLLLENVKGLLSHDKGKTFATILSTLDELGYDAEWQVLNSKDFGVPQNRERVFIIGYLRGSSASEVFPINRKNENSIRVVGNLGEGYRQTNEVLSPDGVSTCIRTFQGGGLEPKVLIEQFSKGYGIACCLDANYAKGTSPGDLGKGRRTHIIETAALTEARSEEAKQQRRMNQKEFGRDYSSRRGKIVKKREDGLANCVTSTQTIEQCLIELPQYRIRKLTPKECWRLQGFSDEAFEKAQEVNSNSQLYKQAGNSVTVNVISAIARELK